MQERMQESEDRIKQNVKRKVTLLIVHCYLYYNSLDKKQNILKKRAKNDKK